jgi:hypothetical protein
VVLARGTRRAAGGWALGADAGRAPAIWLNEVRLLGVDIVLFAFGFAFDEVLQQAGLCRRTAE